MIGQHFRWQSVYVSIGSRHLGSALSRGFHGLEGSQGRVSRVTCCRTARELQPDYCTVLCCTAVPRTQH